MSTMAASSPPMKSRLARVSFVTDADQGFGTMRLPDEPDAVAPDGSDVRVLLRLDRGSMAHFELAPGRVSRAVAHRGVEELWYILRGRGQMWRRQAGAEETVPL